MFSRGDQARAGQTSSVEKCPIGLRIWGKRPWGMVVTGGGAPEIGSTAALSPRSRAAPDSSPVIYGNFFSFRPLEGLLILVFTIDRPGGAFNSNDKESCGPRFRCLTAAEIGVISNRAATQFPGRDRYDWDDVAATDGLSHLPEHVRAVVATNRALPIQWFLARRR